MAFTKNIATLKMDNVKIRATLKINFAKNCATLKYILQRIVVHLKIQKYINNSRLVTQ